MDKLDDLVARHLEERLLDPECPTEILATLLGRRAEEADRSRHRSLGIFRLLDRGGEEPPFAFALRNDIPETYAV